MSWYCVDSENYDNKGLNKVHIYHDLKTLRGAINRMKKLTKHFAVYCYAYFAFDNTWKLVHTQ